MSNRTVLWLVALPVDLLILVVCISQGYARSTLLILLVDSCFALLLLGMALEIYRPHKSPNSPIL